MAQGVGDKTTQTLKEACEKCGCRVECDEDCMLGIANPVMICEHQCSEEELKMCKWYHYVEFFSDYEGCEEDC
jgi:hypothetical protein